MLNQRIITPILAAACLLFAAGCSPLTLTMDLRPSDRGFQMSEVQRDRGASRGAPTVALIGVTGMIADVRTPGVLGTTPSIVDSVAAQLRAVEQDPKVKAVVLRINSPGGTVTGSDILHREIRRFTEESGKPVVASMGEVCASGGYYIALACDEMYAEPTTITASIGVIIQTFNVHDGLSRLGIHARALTSGPNKAMGNPMDPPNEAQTALLQAIVDRFYARFRGVVVDRRGSKIQQGQLDTVTDGRVVIGEHAKELGLIDHTGGIEAAYEGAKRLAGLEKARLVAVHHAGASPRSPWGALASADPNATNADREINLFQVQLGAMDGHPGAGFYYLWIPPELP